MTGAARRWRWAGWAALWLGAPVAVVLGGGGAAGLPVAALAATIAAAALAAFGWGLRPRGAAAPPWRVGAAAAGALGAAGLGAGCLAARTPALAALAAAALLACHLRTQRVLPPGFAPRITALARVWACAAVALWAAALLSGPGAALLWLPPAALAAAAYLGAGPLGAGAVLWEQLRPGLRAAGARSGPAPQRRTVG